MNPQLWWYLARASGIAAWFLVALAVIWGLLLSTKLLGRKPAPAWLLDLHRFLGGLAVVFTAVHLVGLVADSYTHFGPADLLVPMASDWKPGAVAWGVVAFYLLVAVELTSLLMTRIPRRWWRGVHLTSYVLFWVAALHVATAGTDASNLALVTANAVAIVVVLTLTVIRVLTPKRARAVDAGPRPGPSPGADGPPDRSVRQPA